MVLSSLNDIINEICPKISQFTDPHFIFDPPKAVSGTDGLYNCITCCIDGFTNIRWDFRKLNEIQWRSVEEEFKNFQRTLYNDSKRTICITETYVWNIGFYRCLATDDDGRNVSNSIYLYLLHGGETKNIKIIEKTISPRSNYDIGMNIPMNCRGYSYIPNKYVNVKWLFKSHQSYQSITRQHTINTTVIAVNNASTETNPDLVNVSSDIYISNAQLHDNGTYACVIEQNNHTVIEEFLVFIKNDQINLGLLLSIIIVILVVMIVISVSWFKRYDILIIYKTYFDLFPCKEEKEIDVAIVYQDDDLISSQMGLIIVKILEELKLNCWLFDRDKKYGQETIIDLSRIMNQSNTLLVLLTPMSINNNLLTNLSSLRPNPTTRRLYIFNPNIKPILKSLLKSQPTIEKWLKQELNLQSFLRPHSYSFNSVKQTKFHQMVGWILASLPSKVIQKTRQNIFQHNT